jgi:hypothetical protein
VPTISRALMLVALLTAGCQELPEIKLCGEIPSDGCPIGRGGTCADVLCAALYDCTEGRWVEVERCQNGTGGGGGGGGPTKDAGADACTPVTIDHTGETPGCTVDLQHPDCPVEAAEQCAENACLSGCIDFYMCVDESWKDVAFCTEDGQIIVLE